MLWVSLQERKTMTKDEVRGALRAWLESERIRYLVLAGSLPIAPSIPITELVATEVTEASQTYNWRKRFVSPFGTAARLQLMFGAGGEVAPPPTVLYEHYGLRCGFLMGQFFQGTPEEVPHQSPNHLLTQTSTHYL